MLGDGAEDLAVAERAEVGNHQEHGQQEAEVADAVEEERLLARVRGGLTEVVKADQQIGGETHTFPADEHQQKVFCQHQGQHEKHEQVEVGKEAPVAFLVRHVADGVDMDQKSYAGDDQQHDQGQGVEQEGKIGAEGRGLDPGYGQALNVRQGEGAEAEGDAGDHGERGRGKEQGNARNHRLRQAAAQQPIEQKAQEWQQRDQPQMEGWISVHSFIRLT